MAKNPNRENKTGTEQYAAFMRRILRSYSKKALAGELDRTALTQLVELREMLDQQIAETVDALRSPEGGSHSWAEIAEGLGIDRGNAARKYGPRSKAS